MYFACLGFRTKCSVPNYNLLIIVCFRYLGHGLSNKQLSKAYRLGRSTVSKSIFRTLKVIWKNLEKIHLMPPSCEDLKQVSNAFYLKWQIPNCIGCMDEKYFRIKNPPLSEDYKNKKLFSMVFQGITDADYKFLAIEVGSKSKKGGAGTFHFSQLNITLSENKFNIPPPRKLPGTNTIVPHALIGSEAFPLKHFLMRPYPLVKITDDQIIFNKRLSRASVSFKCAFGVVTSKFGIFSKTIETNKEHSELIIKVACLLHNIIREREGDRDEHFLEFWENYTDSDDNFINRKSKSRRNNRATAQALLIRNQLKQYFIDNPVH